jgi:hypothetical protein
MLTERYTAYLVQLAQRNAISANLAGVTFALALVAITAHAWPEPIRPWARRAFIALGVGIYATLFVVGVATLLGHAGMHW